MELTEWITRLTSFFRCSAETAKSIYYSYLSANRLEQLEHLLSTVEAE